MLEQLINAVVRVGTITIVGPQGGRKTFGSGDPRVTVRIRDRAAVLQLGLHPDLRLGELYVGGRIAIEEGDIADLMQILMASLARVRPPASVRAIRGLRRAFKRWTQFNPMSRSKAHVAHHYDLSSKLYDLFLDHDRQYSCAYFSAPGENLDEAQIGKKRHLAAKLHLYRPGLRVLDIGSGWGGLALDLARDCDANVLGITLSEEQIAMATERAAKAGLSESCKFALTDYRALDGKFDRVVSVGMFEHVGVPYYQTYFDKIRELLNDDGVALVHTIGRTDGPGVTNPWISKYIFPGGYTPALSEFIPAIERSGLVITDVEVLRQHYAETLKEWRRRFTAHWQEAAALYDERFCRMWEFYLAGAEMAFRHEGLVVFQVQLAKRIGALPITRDYMLESERTMRFAGVEEMPRQSRAA
ncbi:MAG TPA: cyclopropane-fatty-acyl-phospholipid synthase family protein [Rhizomicrobium sp.]|nr:cyclopropane-fatty-acyl-phospholipid synthase family protein [Rhizomicrobium sp.]